MRIAFYAPFKPLGHKNPSGDLAIARGLVRYLKEQGHTIEIQSILRARWIYFKPWLWFLLLLHFIRCLKNLTSNPPDLWLTYHTYYKAPDLLGPWICKFLKIKYVIFQGIYSTKRRRKLRTIFGFYLNRAALVRADHIFINKMSDFKNLKRIISKERLTYVKPGIKPDEFKKDEVSGKKLRKQWGVKTCPIILTAAMFRDDVKTKGLSWLIKCCAQLIKLKVKFHLVIAGSGEMENELKAIAQDYLPDHHTFVGKIAPGQMFEFYSSGDVFAFPGIRESLGMVYLEAQSCSLPSVAFKNGGIPEVIDDQKTGFLVPMYDYRGFSEILKCLLTDDTLLKQMGENAASHVRKHHDIDLNYGRFEQILCQMSA
ncbi:MAG: glycosyltransferase family 4 protein [Desulfobacula sp.]|uniref:glycosyltransferase family 4 protein n=1 Tax=Desulfobacula sp. TaxID=2593537 RepID=UPI0025C5D9EF|nr:glycosyltransferase family 4 protein [Desulfobacula sp.]MCD4720343.1 glycosyltransferase family 4 protein [Desulfobacula sp.]